MRSRNRKVMSKPIICVGVAATIGVACITGLATNAAISKFNADADRAYAAAVEEVRAKQLADWLAQHGGSSGSNLNYIPEIDNVPIAPTDIIEIDGKFYINADLVVNPDGTHADDCPCYYCRYGEAINGDDKITIDGKDYIYITDPNVNTDNNNNIDNGNHDNNNNSGSNPFSGIDYISIDIDGNAIYLIEKGDTLSQISGMVGYSVDELAEYNDIRNVNLIYEGSSLRIPVTEEFYEYIQKSENSAEASTETSTEENTGQESDATDDISTETPVIQESTETEVVLPPLGQTSVENPTNVDAQENNVKPKPAPAPTPDPEPVTETKAPEKPKVTKLEVTKPTVTKPVEDKPVQTEKLDTDIDDIEIVEEPFEEWEGDILYDYEEDFDEEIFLDDLLNDC